MPQSNSKYNAWNPGLNSQIPSDILPLSTMFREDNVSTGYDEALELADICGLRPREIVAFRPERLIVHELLIRVTADLSVPDGPNYEDLGINLRAIVAKILESYIKPHMETLNALHKQLQDEAIRFVEQELTEHLFSNQSTIIKPNIKRSLFDRLLGRTTPIGKPAKPGSKIDLHLDALIDWKERSASTNDPFETACFDAMVKVVTAILRRRGWLASNMSTITGIVVNLIGNDYGSVQLGRAIEPFIRQAVTNESYRFLPSQKKPVVMNVKGASAAGKSTIRPQQRELAARLNLPWEDFALISPDYWRKFLLDYDSLGDANKYAAMLTGHELEIIDKKLDHYMAAKAAKGAMSHLLIDRFRFDSFTIAGDRDVDTKLLTRFGHTVFMFFMITPPDVTVERAWNRGIATGRYKAVDDLLYHNVEAYTGMPRLFFSWAVAVKKRVHYEFLDNDVPEGQKPRTVAFGWNRTMTILDIRCMLDIERFRNINIDANRPEDVYKHKNMNPVKNIGFLKQCADLMDVINFANDQSGYVYARLERGKWTWRDDDYAAKTLKDPESKAALDALGWHLTVDSALKPAKALDLKKEKAYTLGRW